MSDIFDILTSCCTIHWYWQWQFSSTHSAPMELWGKKHGYNTLIKSYWTLLNNDNKRTRLVWGIGIGPCFTHNAALRSYRMPVCIDVSGWDMPHYYNNMIYKINDLPGLCGNIDCGSMGCADLCWPLHEVVNLTAGWKQSHLQFSCTAVILLFNLVSNGLQSVWAPQTGMDIIALAWPMLWVWAELPVCSTNCRWGVCLKPFENRHYNWKWLWWR